MTEGDRSSAAMCGRPRGFTLIELVIALAASALLVGMLLAIFARISVAYRGQRQIAGIQRVLAAARATIELDAKQAGLALPQGFTTAVAGSTRQAPVQVTGGAAGPDQIAFFYADPTIQALVIDASSWPTVTVDSTAGFSAGDLVVLSTVATTPSSTASGILAGTATAGIATYDACVLQVAEARSSGGHISFTPDAPWGTPAEEHCTRPIGQRTMLYRFVAHAYRIDASTPARAALGPLQQSQTGGLLGAAEVWSDLAYGFTDLQVAMQVRDNARVDRDGDGDADVNWYASGVPRTQAPYDASSPPALLQGSIRLVARADRHAGGIATPKAPTRSDPAHPDRYPIGNHPEEVLPAGDGRIDPSTTFQVDFRNLGVGQ